MMKKDIITQSLRKHILLKMEVLYKSPLEIDSLRIRNHYPNFNTFAGPLFNFILALVLFIGLAYYQGTPTNTIGEVVKHSPADQAGLHKGDKIVEIGDHKIKDFSEIRKVLDDNKTSKTTIKVQRDHHLKQCNLNPKGRKQN